MNNPAVKRLARELQEVRSDSQDILIEAEPLQVLSVRQRPVV